MHIETPAKRTPELVEALADVWERSVRATHGFRVEGRSPLDDAGRPFPLLHMRLGA